MRILQRIFLPQSDKDGHIDANVRFLHIALWFTFITAIYFASINTELTEIAFWVLATSSMGGLVLNYFQKYLWSSSILILMGTVVLFFNFIDGVSLNDPGIVALPLLIILTSFLFGSRRIYRITLVLILGVLMLGYLERTGVISPTYRASNERLIIISTLLIFIAVLQKSIIQNWERATLSAKLSEQRIHEAYVLTLEGWAKTLEFHDRETLGHSQRVTTLCLRLAESSGIVNHQELEHIRWGALLHDIGKLAIPLEILNKKGELTMEDWEIIRRHPIYAEELLGNINFLKPALDIPRFHHENWDGTGYPHKLKGEAIPFQARIFSLVDNWDALITNRPYRKAWSREETINYIREQSGIKFDPKIVDVFLTRVITGD